jgi:hypothetical protein
VFFEFLDAIDFKVPQLSAYAIEHHRGTVVAFQRHARRRLGSLENVDEQVLGSLLPKGVPKEILKVTLFDPGGVFVRLLPMPKLQ